MKLSDLPLSRRGNWIPLEDAGDAALDAVVAGGVLEDLDAFDVTVADDGEADRHLAGELAARSEARTRSSD